MATSPRLLPSGGGIETAHGSSVISARPRDIQPVTGAKVLEPLRETDPEVVGGFRLAGRLGQGAMGVVYLSYRATRPVAVKVVRPELAEDSYFRQRFAQEVEAIRRVGGFHTAALVDAGTQAAQPWIATSYVHAPSLSSLVEQHGPVNKIGAWWIAAGLADALLHIHSVHLLHRDLKPGNVLVAAEGIRVIDFGICHIDGSTGLTSADSVLGTLAYMAPEQALDSRMASEAADVYGLGATLVHAATGHAPFFAQSPVQRTLDISPDLSGLPQALHDMVAHTLAFDAEDRPTPQDILEEAMENLLAEGVPLSGPLNPPLPPDFLADLLAHRASELEQPQIPAASGAVSVPPAAASAVSKIEEQHVTSSPRHQEGSDSWAERWRRRMSGRRADYGG